MKSQPISAATRLSIEVGSDREEQTVMDFIIVTAMRLLDDTGKSYFPHVLLECGAWQVSSRNSRSACGWESKRSRGAVKVHPGCLYSTCLWHRAVTSKAE